VLGKQLKQCAWPVFDPALATEAHVTLVVQVNGKTRADIVVARGAQQADVESAAREAVHKWIDGMRIVKVIFVKDRLINFVIVQ
jgi:leucyl-tRNA synthetase